MILIPITVNVSVEGSVVRGSRAKYLRTIAKEVGKMMGATKAQIRNRYKRLKKSWTNYRFKDMGDY